MRYRKINQIDHKPLITDDVINLLLEDADINGIYLSCLDELNQYNKSKNKLCKHPALLFDVADNHDHQFLTNIWYFPDKYKDIDIRLYILDKCTTDVEVARVNHELDLYEDRDLFDLLRLMIFLVDYFRTNRYVWGVGRGSSVSSYVLYLIGIHKIDSIKYDLQIEEFLRE